MIMVKAWALAKIRTFFPAFDLLARFVLREMVTASTHDLYFCHDFNMDNLAGIFYTQLLEIEVFHVVN